MKRLPVLSLLAATLLTMPIMANANSWICPFTDYFALNIAPSGKIMGEPKVVGNLSYTQQSDTFFSLSCADGGIVSPGDVTMDIGFNDKNRCTIVLHDGPYVVNPSVTTVSCLGEIYFNGMDHLIGSHNYTLNFGG